MDPQSNTSSGVIHTRLSSVPIGPILVIILLAVVTSVATGVLVNTTGIIKSSSGTINSSSAPADTPPITVVEKTGHITTNSSATVKTVALTVQRNAGAASVNLANVTIDWFGPTGHTRLTYGGEPQPAALTRPASEFAINAEQDSESSHPRLASTQGQLTIRIHAAAIVEDGGLTPGTTVALKLTFPSGNTHFLTLDVPQSLDHQSTVFL